jgi:DNA-binding transcriptional MerR regulator
MANFNIYIPQKYEPILEGLSQDGESIGQVIKRLVLGMLDGDDRQTSPMPSDIGDRLDNLENQLTHVTEQVEARFALCAQDGDRLGELSDRLEQLENNQGLSPDDLERLAAILTRDYLGDRLEKIEKHLDWAKREILDQRQKIKGLESDAYWYQGDKPETAIMIQKQPLPPADPAPVPTEITLTDAEVAARYDVAKRTVTTWKKRDDLRPEDLEWDGDRKIWFLAQEV